MPESAVSGSPGTVLVVRPRAQADAWVGELAALGVAARALPLIEIVPVPDAAGVEALLDEIEAEYQGFVTAAEPIQLVNYHSNCAL